MKIKALTVFVLVLTLNTGVFAQGNPDTGVNWYSESITNGITIQNSLPKGGPYPGRTERYFHYSYLVFFHRIVNETAEPKELSIHFSADSVAIPGSPDTFVKIFLPADTMTLGKRFLFSYGLKELASLEKPTSLERTIPPHGDFVFYVVGVFYQTRTDIQDRSRGGNRAEFILHGDNLFYSMSPQIKSLPCGRIVSVK